MGRGVSSSMRTGNLKTSRISSTFIGWSCYNTLFVILMPQRCCRAGQLRDSRFSKWSLINIWLRRIFLQLRHLRPFLQGSIWPTKETSFHLRNPRRKVSSHLLSCLSNSQPRLFRVKRPQTVACPRRKGAATATRCSSATKKTLTSNNSSTRSVRVALTGKISLSSISSDPRAAMTVPRAFNTKK